MIIDEYHSEIEQTIELLKSIKSFNFSSINIYGSANNEKLFKRGCSDIDMIFMEENFKKQDLQAIIDEISARNLDFKEKKPMIIDDSLCKRIEFYINYPDIAVDISLTPGLIPSMESLERNACYDNFEALMGGVYVYSKSIAGEIPDYERFQKEFYPFYSDELRSKRLDVLAKKIINTNKAIKKYIDDESLNITDHIYKIRKHFIQFLYIYYREYFLSPEKHTYYQLTNILNLPEEEKEIICLSKGNVFNAAKEYLALSDYYINKYKEESPKRVRRK